MELKRKKSRFAIAIGLWCLVSLVIAICFFPSASPSERAVAFRTIGLGLMASMVALPVGGLIAWACQGKGILSRVLFVCTIAMLLVPLFIHVSGWDAAFGKLGWLTSTKGQIFVPLVSGWTAAVWIHGIAAAPQVALILLIGLSTGRRSYEEQALLDVGPSGVFWHVTIRRLIPLLLLCVVWIVVSCAREIGVTDLYQIGTLAEQIYLGFSLGINSIAGTWTPEQLAEANSISNRLTFALLVWLAATGLLFFFSLTELEFEGGQIRPLGSPSYMRKSQGPIQSLTAAALLVLVVLIPVFNVIVRACFFVRPVNGVPTQGYSISQLMRSVRRACGDYQDEFGWSFLIAAVSSTLIMVVAIAFASAARRMRWLQVVFAILLATCCAIPGPYIGTTLAELFSKMDNETIQWFYNYTIAAPVIANFIFCWPIGALIVWFVFRKVPLDVMDSAKVEGAGSLQRAIQFGVKGNLLAIAGSFLLTFAFSFGELSASQIVRPAGIDTVPRKMLGDLHAGVNELTAGITIVTAFTIVTISLVGWWFLRLNQQPIGRQ